MSPSKNAELFTDMPMEEYLGMDAISSSQVRAASKSPLHYLAAKHGGGSEETAAMRLGTMAHTMVLEPEKFEDNYIVFANGGSKTKNAVNGGCKELWGEAKKMAAESGRQIVDGKELTQVTQMRDAVMAHPIAAQLLNDNRMTEATITWEDERAGKMKARPDIIHRSGIMVDFKTTKDASPRMFGGSAAKFQYPTQAAHHREGVYAALDAGLLDHLFHERPEVICSVLIACETTPSVWNEKLGRMDYAVAVYSIDEAQLLSALAISREALYEAINSDPEITQPYGNQILPLALPAWWSQP